MMSKKIFVLFLLSFYINFLSAVNIQQFRQIAPAIGKTVLKKTGLAACYLYVGAVVAVVTKSSYETIYAGMTIENKQKADKALCAFKKRFSN